MKKLLALAILLSLGMGSTAYADGMTDVVGATTLARTTRTVFNDSGSTLTSGTVVIWDNDDTEFDDSGYPYVTVTTTADDDWVAGVLVTGSCPNQALCEIVVDGPALTLCADATDAVAEDTAVATSTVSGQCGDYGTGANTSSLGILMEDDGASNDTELLWVFVRPTQY